MPEYENDDPRTADFFRRLGSWVPKRQILRKFHGFDRSFFEKHFSHTLCHPLFWARYSIKSAIKKHTHLLSGRLLDAGCGSRLYEELVTPHINSYTAVDISPKAIPDKKGPDVLCDLQDLPFPDNSFDCILCTEVLEHIENPTAALQEFHRVIAPGGIVLCTVPQVFPVHDIRDYRRFTGLGLAKLFENHKFRIVDIIPLCGSGRTISLLLCLFLFDQGTYWTIWLYPVSIILRPVILLLTAVINLIGYIGDMVIPSFHLAFGHLIISQRPENRKGA